MKSLPGRATRNRVTIGAACSGVSPLPCHPSADPGVREAALAEGKKTGSGVHVVQVPDVRAFRQQLHMSQQHFA